MSDNLFVSIILPIRNEARYIERCLNAVIGQDYPPDRIEILVVDGLSNDGTRELVAEFGVRDQRVRLIDNPEQIVPAALNRGIHAARGDVIVRVDGHAVIARDNVSQCVDKLNSMAVDCVGGPIAATGDSWLARGIAIAASSPFGVGNSAFRYANEGQFVDTLAFGAYRREVFARIGLFDEELVRNQDDEFNFRLIRAGGKIWLDPRIKSTYYSRTSLTSLWKQYVEYGFWKVRVIQKHGRPASWRHVVPITFVLALFVASGLSILTRSPLWFLAIAVPYAVTSLGVSLWLAERRGWKYAPLLPLAFAAMHLGYGFGFLVGLSGLVRMKPWSSAHDRAISKT